jgi:hypothetical protein
MKDKYDAVYRVIAIIIFILASVFKANNTVYFCFMLFAILAMFAPDFLRMKRKAAERKKLGKSPYWAYFETFIIWGILIGLLAVCVWIL